MQTVNEVPYSPPPHNGLDLLHIDASLLIINKPAGLLSVPGRGKGKDDCLISRVQTEFPDALIVHRLDMETSGLMVLARGKTAHRQLSLLFQSRQVNKAYVAIVDGRLEQDAGEIDLPLITDWPNRPRQMVDFSLGKASLTRYRRLAYNADNDSTRVELYPETGRSHQLRVHLLSLGHPIIGDPLYAPPKALTKAKRLLLHASYLAFTDPHSGLPLAFDSTPDF